MNYKQLLEKYMKLVFDVEGTDFCHAVQGDEEFTLEEQQEIQRISDANYKSIEVH